MNWKIKEFTVRAKSMRKELALLVKQGSKGTSGLPRASTFLQIQPFTYWGCGLRPAGSTHRDVPRLMQLSVAPPTTQTPTLCSAAPDRQFHIGKLSVLFHCKPFILRHTNMDSRRKPYDLVWVMTAVILTSGRGGRTWLQICFIWIWIHFKVQPVLTIRVAWNFL